MQREGQLAGGRQPEGERGRHPTRNPLQRQDMDRCGGSRGCWDQVAFQQAVVPARHFGAAPVGPCHFCGEFGHLKYACRQRVVSNPYPLKKECEMHKVICESNSSSADLINEGDKDEGKQVCTVLG